MSERFAVTGARVCVGDGSAPLTEKAVVISDGVIVDLIAVGGLSSDLRKVEYRGATVLPGLVNLHSHMVPRSGCVLEKSLVAAERARRALFSGITTSRDLGAPEGLDIQLRDAVRAGLAAGPRLLVAARPITRTGGHNYAFAREVDGECDGRRAVREQVRAGADCIKLMASEGWNHPDTHRLGLRVDEMRSIVDEAHRIGFQVTAHAQGPAATEGAIRAGVDCVEHATDGITDAVIRLFLDTGTPLDSTSSSAWAVAHGMTESELPEHIVHAARRQVESERSGLAKCVAEGVRIAGATDMHGTMALQFKLLLEAGMAPYQAIAALTSIPASVLGRSDIGLVAPRRRADLLIIDGDPASDSTALERVLSVYHDGARVAGTPG